MLMRDLYLNMLTQSKFELLYYNAYFGHAYRVDNFLKIALTILTADFVANWAIWQTHTDIWAIGIAVSQVIQLINGLLPYSKRVDTLGPLHRKLESIYSDMENGFIKILLEDMDIEKANDLRTKYQKEWDENENTALLKDIIPRVPWLVKCSDREKVQYFKTLMGNDAVEVKTEAIELTGPFNNGRKNVPLKARTKSFIMPSQQTTMHLDMEKLTLK